MATKCILSWVFLLFDRIFSECVACLQIFTKPQIICHFTCLMSPCRSSTLTASFESIFPTSLLVSNFFSVLSRYSFSHKMNGKSRLFLKSSGFRMIGVKSMAATPNGRRSAICCSIALPLLEPFDEMLSCECFLWLTLRTAFATLFRFVSPSFMSIAPIRTA